jgi:MSHA biogenesis protein MshO
MKSLRTYNSKSLLFSGFTLIELLVVMVIVGIGAALTIGYLVNPIEAFNDMQLRGRLTERADVALYKMTRDIRQGVPNSIRITSAGSLRAIEVIQMRSAGRYRASGTGDALDATGDADSFDVLGGLPGFGAVQTGGAGIANCINGSADCLVIYNTGTSATANNAYDGDNVATITAASANSLSFNNADGSPAFPLLSPAQRFYVARGPVSYVCDLGAQEVRRYSGYALQSTQPVFAGGGDLLTNNVSGCNFNYVPGTNSRSGVVTMELSISESGETITLLQQAHIFNSP